MLKPFWSPSCTRACHLIRVAQGKGFMNFWIWTAPCLCLALILMLPFLLLCSPFLWCYYRRQQMKNASELDVRVEVMGEERGYFGAVSEPIHRRNP